MLPALVSCHDGACVSPPLRTIAPVPSWHGSPRAVSTGGPWGRMSIPRRRLVGQFTDPLSLAERPDDEAATSVVDHLVRHLEDLAGA